MESHSYQKYLQEEVELPTMDTMAMKNQSEDPSVSGVAFVHNR